MNFEKIQPEENQTESVDETAKKAQEYYEQFPEGLARDAEKALNQTERFKYLEGKEGPAGLKEVYEKITEIVDSKHIAGYTEQILRAIKNASMQYAKDYKNMEGFTGYDYSMDKIREELKNQGVPVKEKKSRADLL